MIFRTPLKTAFFLSSLSVLAAACAVNGAPPADGDDEVTGSSESALICRDCDPAGGADPTPPRLRPSPTTPPTPAPPPPPQPTGDDTCYLPGCKDLNGIQAIATTTLDFSGWRCEPASTQECVDERGVARDTGMATERAVEYMRIRDAFPLFKSRGVISGLCRCGCFEASTEILTADAEGNVDWKAVSTVEQDDRMMSLSEGASLRRPELEPKSVVSHTRGKEKPLLFAFVLDNGHTLKVTQHHGMVLDDGRVVAASEVRAGARFLGIDGKPVTILAIERERTRGLVYNFEVDAKKNQGHVLAAEGVLVGDLAWQNRLKSELGAIQIRK